MISFFSKVVAAKLGLRACLNFAFGANAAKFCSGQGVMKEHSPSYVTEEQRSTGQNLARAAQSVIFKQALKKAAPFQDASNVVTDHSSENTLAYDYHPMWI